MRQQGIEADDLDIAVMARAPRASCTRCSSGSAGPLDGLCATPTTTFSNSGAARLTRSI